MRLLLILLTFVIIAPVFLQGGVELTACGTGSSPTGQILSGADAAGNCSTTSVGKVATDVVNILSILVGIVAVIMVIYGGFRYVTSAGDAQRASQAKNTIIYALIGIVIAALAQFIVQYVLGHAIKAS